MPVAADLKAYFKDGNLEAQKLLFEGATDLSRELGLTHQKTLRQKKLMAMNDPNKFNTEKEAEYVKLETQVKASFQTSFEQYIAAGYSTEDAKRKAMKIAHATKATLEDGIEDLYGSDAGRIGLQKQAQEAAFKDKTLVNFKH
jgi:hypothetical protein